MRAHARVRQRDAKSPISQKALVTAKLHGQVWLHIRCASGDVIPKFHLILRYR